MNPSAFFDHIFFRLPDEGIGDMSAAFWNLKTMFLTIPRKLLFLMFRFPFLVFLDIFGKNIDEKTNQLLPNDYQRSTGMVIIFIIY